MSIITQIWHRTKCYFTSISNTLYLITVPHKNKITTFFSEISQQTLNLWKNCHIYWNLAQSQISFCMHQWPMVHHHGTQYEENPSSHHGVMHEARHLDRLLDGLMGRLTDSTRSYIPRIHLGGAGNNVSFISNEVKRKEVTKLLINIESDERLVTWDS